MVNAICQCKAFPLVDIELEGELLDELTFTIIIQDDGEDLVTVDGTGQTTVSPRAEEDEIRQQSLMQILL